MPSDLEALQEMGFERAKAEIAVRKSGGLQGALEWLEKVQDKSLEDITAENDANAESDPSAPPADPSTEEEAKSLVCNDCGSKFRSHAMAEIHASKTGHVDFAESTEEIAPLTEEEKKAKLEELRAKAAAKRAGGSEQDRIDKKRNEEIRRKSTKESQDIKEELQKKEQLKEAAAKKREKQEEIEAKAKIKAKIAADKEERRVRSEREKAERAGQAPLSAVTPTSANPVVSTTSKPASAYTETRLRLQLPSGPIQKTFPVETSLFEVATAIAEEKNYEVSSFTQTFPKKVFDTVDFGATLKELGLIPSAALIVK